MNGIVRSLRTYHYADESLAEMRHGDCSSQLDAFRVYCLQVLVVLSVQGTSTSLIQGRDFLALVLDLLMDACHGEVSAYPTWASALLLVLCKRDRSIAATVLATGRTQVFRHVEQHTVGKLFHSTNVPHCVMSFLQLDSSEMHASWCCNECSRLLHGVASTAPGEAAGLSMPAMPAGIA